MWVAIVLLLAATVWALGDSYVRIVRISFLTSRVDVRRPLAPGGALGPEARWTPALLNAPIVQNEKIRTGSGGEVEIQLECGSALRLAPNSEMSVNALRLRDDGVHATRVAVTGGEAFFSVRRADSADFHLALADGAVATPEGAARLRVTAPADGPATVELLDGHAQVELGKHVYPLRKSAVLELQPGGMVAWVAAPAPDQWAQWSHRRDQLFERAIAASEPKPVMDASSDQPPPPPAPPATGTKAATALLNNPAGVFAEMDTGSLSSDPFFAGHDGGPMLVPGCANN